MAEMKQTSMIAIGVLAIGIALFIAGLAVWGVRLGGDLTNPGTGINLGELLASVGAVAVVVGLIFGIVLFAAKVRRGE